MSVTVAMLATCMDMYGHACTHVVDKMCDLCGPLRARYQSVRSQVANKPAASVSATLELQCAQHLGRSMTGSGQDVPYLFGFAPHTTSADPCAAWASQTTATLLCKRPNALLVELSGLAQTNSKCRHCFNCNSGWLIFQDRVFYIATLDVRQPSTKRAAWPISWG